VVRCNIQFLVDTQSVSLDCGQKSVQLVRCSDDVSAHVHVSYTVFSLAETTGERPGVLSGVELLRMEAQGKALPSMMAHKGVEICSGEVDFHAGDMQVDLQLETPKHNQDYFVQLTAADVIEEQSSQVLTEVTLGPIRSTLVRMSPIDSGGVFRWPKEAIEVAPQQEKFQIELVVVRGDGCSGDASVKWRTERFDAIPEYDFTSGEGDLLFEEGVTEQTIEIDILPKSAGRVASSFLVILEEADGAEFDAERDGEEDAAILTVSLLEVKDRDGGVLRSIDRYVSLGGLALGHACWREQFASSVLCNGSWEDQKYATVLDWVFHIVALPWKLLFALCPSSQYLGGWVCFVGSLFFIGLVTALIADLAEIFGCVLDIDGMMTGITFVALGTSMPDLFASKIAATEEPTADASIVNVTGSNSVNVFLGVGLPWTLAAIYWSVTGRTEEWEREYGHVVGSGRFGFVVEAGSLAFSVVCFTFCASVALCLLFLRRKLLGCELGGPTGPKVAATVSMVSLWLGFVFLVGWGVGSWESSSTNTKAGVLGSAAALELAIAAGAVALTMRHRVAREVDDVVVEGEVVETVPEAEFEEPVQVVVPVDLADLGHAPAPAPCAEDTDSLDPLDASSQVGSDPRSLPSLPLASPPLPWG